MGLSHICSAVCSILLLQTGSYRQHSTPSANDSFCGRLTRNVPWHWLFGLLFLQFPTTKGFLSSVTKHADVRLHDLEIKGIYCWRIYKEKKSLSLPDGFESVISNIWGRHLTLRPWSPHYICTFLCLHVYLNISLLLSSSDFLTSTESRFHGVDMTSCFYSFHTL